MRRFPFWTITCLLSVGPIFSPIQADEPARGDDDPPPADTCVLRLRLPPDAHLTVEGRDYGTKREITWKSLRLGSIAVSNVVVRFADGGMVNRSVLVEGGRALQLSLQSPKAIKPEIVLQAGHADYISDANFSPDGKWLATASNDGSVILWDAGNGREKQRLRHAESVSQAIFSHDSGTLYTASDKTISVFDVLTGAKKSTFAASRDSGISAAALSADSRRFATSTWSSGGAIRVWDLPKARLVRELRLYRDDKAFYSYGRELHFHPKKPHLLTCIHVAESRATAGYPQDEKYRAMNARDQAHSGQAYYERRKEWNLLVLWNIDTGKKLWTITLSGRAYLRPIFSSDATMVVGTLYDNKTKSSRLLAWDAATGRELKRRDLDAQTPEWRTALASGPNCDEVTRLAGADGKATIETFHLPDLNLRSESVALPGGEINCRCVDKSFGRVVVVGEKTNLACWDIRAGTELWRSVGRTPLQLTFPSSGSSLLAQNSEAVFLVDATSQAIMKPLWSKDEHHYLFNAAIFPQCRRVLVNTSLDNHRSHELFLYDSDTGQLVSHFQTADYDDFVPNIELSRDGKLALARVDGAALVWDTQTGERIGRFATRSDGKPEFVLAATFARDGEAVLVGVIGYSHPQKYASHGLPTSVPVVYWWQPRSGEYAVKLTVSDGAHHAPGAIALSPDGRRILTADIGGECRIWEYGGALVKWFRINTKHADVFPSPDGALLVVGGDHNKTDILDARNGSILRTITRRVSWIGKPISFAFHDRLMAISQEDGFVTLYDISTGSELLRIARLAGDEDWIAVTPEGLFDGTEAARNLVAFRAGSSKELVPVDRFFQDHYRPGLINDFLRGDRSLPSGEIAMKVAPSVKITSPRQGSTSERGTVAIEAEITDRGGGIREPWVMHNGSRILAEAKSERHEKLLHTSFTLPLIDGENRIEVRSASGDGSWESDPAVLVLKYEKPLAKPAVHLVAVGINQYRQEAMNLRFAAGDARDLADVFQARGPALYGAERTRVTQLIDEQATQQGIRDVLAQVAKVANPQDTVVVFLAGHGTTIGQRYYFITQEFKPEAEHFEDDVRSQGLAADAIGDLLTKTRALKRVLIFDTCQSGGALALHQTARDPFAFRGALERLSHSQGVFTIAAAAANDQAQEAPQLKHGLLTYALLAGLGAVHDGPLAGQKLKPTGDANVAEVREWFSFAQDKVPLLTKLYFGHEQFIGFSGQGASFPVLPLDDK